MLPNAGPKGRILLLVHRQELAYQAQDRMAKIAGTTPEIEMGEFRASGHESEAPIVIASVQTLSRPKRLAKFNPWGFSLIVIDEAHHAVAATYKRVIEHFSRNPSLRILGVTATPDRKDERAMGQVFDSVAFEYQLPDAIEDGWLVPIQQQYVVVEDLDFSKCRTTAGDLNQGDLDRIMRQEEILHGVVTPTVEVAGDRPTILFTTSVEQAHQSCDIINRHRPDKAFAIDGKTPREQREELLEAFKNGEKQFLVNCMIATEGFDAPSAAVVAVARPTASRALYSQMVGRGTRPLPGVVDGAADRIEAIAESSKPHVTVLDFVGNSGRHKLISTADILGGKYDDEVVADAVRKAKESPKAVDMDRELKNAAARWVDKKRRHIMAQARYRAQNIDPFALYDVAPTREPGWHKGRKPSEKMQAMLLKNGVTEKEVEGMSFWKAKQLIGTIIEAREKDGATLKQRKVLVKYGENPDVGFREASAIIDEIAKAGWKPRAKQS